MPVSGLYIDLDQLENGSTNTIVQAGGNIRVVFLCFLSSTEKIFNPEGCVSTLTQHQTQVNCIMRCRYLFCEYSELWMSWTSSSQMTNLIPPGWKLNLVPAPTIYLSLLIQCHRMSPASSNLCFKGARFFTLASSQNAVVKHFMFS